jgi:penicillin-binding protein 2
MLVRRDADDIREIRPRAALCALMVVCAMCLLIVRLYQLQIARGDDYVQQSISNYRKFLFVPADRGLLKDRNGQVLVENRPSFDIFLTPAFCRGKEKEAVMAQLAIDLKMEKTDVDRMHRDYDKSVMSKDKLERFKPYAVEVDIPRDQVDVIESHRAQLSCVDLIPSPHRSYRAGNALGHVLGFMSEVTPEELEKDTDHRYRRGQTIGRRGIERRWEKELRGEDGKETIAVDAQGRKLDEAVNQLLIPEEERYVPATPGNNLVLSLDMRLEEIADKAFPGRAGAVVVMEAKTGFLLALVSRPSFDANKMSQRITAAENQALNEDPLKPLINRVMNENYHPGSTFKVVLALAGLDKGTLTPSTNIFCNGGYTVGNHRWRCDNPKGHGSLDMKRAIQVSCDVFFYALGDRLGLDPIAQMAHALGYGQPTGFDLGKEIPGIIPDTDWVIKTFGAYSKGHAINAAIGQGEINVTPLQQAVAYAAIGNGGAVYRPQIVKRLESYDGSTLQTFDPIVERQLDFKPLTIATVRAGLTAVPNEPGGTAYSVLKDIRWRGEDGQPVIKFAGKTGTAQVVTLGSKQKLKPEDQEYLSRDHAWFAAYAPAVDPEIVVVVINEHGGWGATGAAPTASKIIDGYFQLKAQDAAARLAQANGTGDGGIGPLIAPIATPVAAAPLNADGEVTHKPRALPKRDNEQLPPEEETPPSLDDDVPDAGRSREEKKAARPARTNPDDAEAVFGKDDSSAPPN